MNSSKKKKKKKKKGSWGILILAHFVEMWWRVGVGASYKKGFTGTQRWRRERGGPKKFDNERERESERGGKKFGEKNTYILVAFFCVCRLENVYGFMTRLLRKFKYIYF